MYQHGGDVYRNKNMIDFSVNINLMGIPDSVVEAAQKGVSMSYQYPDTECLELRNAISTHVEYPVESIICGNGAADLIISIVLALRPKKALIPVPSFHEYEQALSVLDCQLEYHVLLEEHNFSIQEDFIDHITLDQDVIFLCNPNNPTGELTSQEMLMRIIKRCEETQTLLVVDECFMDFTNNPDAYSMLKHCRDSNYLIILKAFTKLYAMPGLRLGYAISGNQEFIKKMKEVAQPWSVSIPAQMAGIAALADNDYKVDSLMILKEERAYLLRQLEALHIKHYGSHANYIFFHTGNGFYEFCHQKNILIRDCSNYQGLESGYYRIAVKKHQENEYFISVLKEWIKWQNQ